jgi:plastocyanin
MPSSSRRSSSSLVRGALVAVVAAAAWLPAATRAAEHTVTIDGVKFEPASITVARGDTIAWVNKDPFPHTATAPRVFDSREIAAGKSWKWTASQPGVYDYVCTLHPTMKGTVTVK